MSENLKLWEKLGRTDPKHTKPFQRSGGFKGTAIKPIYTEQKMTEEFGPCGTGWGVTEPQFQTVPASEGQVAVYCWLSLWYMLDGKKSEPVPGVGGDFVTVKQSSGLRTNDEAFKAAFTDAIGNAMKHIGMSADVHMGRFDDSKYVREVADELKAEATGQTKGAPRTARGPESLPAPTDDNPFDDFPGDVPTKVIEPAISTAAINIGREFKACKSRDDLISLWKSPRVVDFLKKCNRVDGESVVGAKDARKAALADADNVLAAG